MPIPEFPTKDDLNLPNERLGARLLTIWIATEAERLGVDPNAQGFADIVRQSILTKKARSAETAAVERALHEAASGDFETAGEFLRQHIKAGVDALKFIPIGKKKWAQAVKFGRKGAEGNKAKGKANRSAVLDAAKAILAERQRRPSWRELERLVATKTGIHFNTVRGHILKLRKDRILD